MKRPILRLNDNKILSVKGLKEALREFNNSDIEDDDYINVETLFEIIDEVEQKELLLGK